MKFIQIIEYSTSRPEEIKQLMDEFLEQHGGEMVASTGYSCKDRDTQGKYADVIIFNSYDEAMKNNQIPGVQEFAEKMTKLSDGPPTFHNLDVIREDSTG